MTLVLCSTAAPGSAHIMRGRERAGRPILKGYLVLLGIAALLAFVAALSKKPLIELAVRSEVLSLLQYATLGIAVGWCLVIVSAAFVGGAVQLRVRHRSIAAVVVLAACLLVSTPLVFIAQLASAQRGLIGAVFAEGAGPGELPDRLNILLLGGDGAAGRPGVRTDSVNLASIDTETGHTIMFSLPRNLQDVPFPDETALHARFPNGFDCGDECLLNAVHSYGAANPDLFRGVRDPGAEAVKHAVTATLGLPVHYYVLVNMDGFRDIVDAFGGITIRVEQRVPIGGISTPIRGYIEPGLQELDGYEALWYARSRAESSDYDRMARQRCVMGAILNQADPLVILRRYERIADGAKNLVSTDIPRGLLPDLIDLAFKARGQDVTNVQFVPPLIKTGNPDFDLIRRVVSEAIDGSAAATPAADTTPPATAAAEPPSPDSAPASGAADGESPPGGDSMPLKSTCSYS